MAGAGPNWRIRVLARCFGLGVPGACVERGRSGVGASSHGTPTSRRWALGWPGGWVVVPQRLAATSVRPSCGFECTHPGVAITAARAPDLGSNTFLQDTAPRFVSSAAAAAARVQLGSVGSDVAAGQRLRLYPRASTSVPRISCREGLVQIRPRNVRRHAYLVSHSPVCVRMLYRKDSGRRSRSRRAFAPPFNGPLPSLQAIDKMDGTIEVYLATHKEGKDRGVRAGGGSAARRIRRRLRRQARWPQGLRRARVHRRARRRRTGTSPPALLVPLSSVGGAG